MQLVLINNRIVAHGENFLAMGGVVINTATGARYDNATIAECSGCPSDIDQVGYEYHAGVFVPCAPFAKGEGNVAVWCDDCKAPLDSGFPSQFLRKMFTTTYTGTGTALVSITCGFKPILAIVSSQTYSLTVGTSRVDNAFTAIINGNGGLHYGANGASAYGVSACALSSELGDDFVAWAGADERIAMNEAGAEYTVTVIG